MKKKLVFLVTLICFFLTQNLIAQTANYQDVVYLKNGSIIKGIIIENMPGGTIKLQTVDGNLFVYNYSDIEKFGKENVAAKNVFVKDEKSQTLSCLLSLLLPGGGQYYNGEIAKGAIMTGLYLGSYVLIMTSADETAAAFGGITLLGDCLWSIIDAPVSASRINKAKNNFASIRIGKDSFLSLRPDIMLVREPTLCLGSRLEPVLGMKLKLSL